ncbi:hypothetical protein H6G76_09090 [Nostoc sp. FACHB-152]|uniref:hypothetical protein n=1 Tax=unclassified Nostoc TaxID=2593658 RepID=UPI001687B31B|nr:MULTISPECIES: hypothetical protein [unclassified Nostoc]MBD2447320.1 hypothetical protein [Nostoc sp. FACHB-152]MBD2468079.1 hypothetical protein [Nostoc sp. FACHB-145]
MKTNLKNERILLFKLVCQGLKYLLWFSLGLAVALVISHVFGTASITQFLLWPSLWLWFLRSVAFLLCLLMIAMILESWR